MENGESMQISDICINSCISKGLLIVLVHINTISLLPIILLNHLLSPSRQRQQQRKRKPSLYKRLELLIFLVIRYLMSFLRFSFTAYAVELILLRTIRFQPALRRTVPPCSLQYLRLLSSLLYTRHAAVFSPPSCGQRKVLSCCPCC